MVRGLWSMARGLRSVVRGLLQEKQKAPPEGRAICVGMKMLLLFNYSF